MKETCPHCGKAFKKLKHHIRDVHAAKNLVKCDQCDKQYPEGRLFKDHMNKTHMSSLNDEPLAKYLETTVCPVCGDTLLATRLARHLRLRHFLPPHHVVECPLCGAHVKWLAFHLTKQHKKEGGTKKLHRCRKCDQYFLTSTALSAHLANHEEYKCKECHQTFQAHLSLAAHLFTAHGKVFNIGKKFKSGRNQWDVGGFTTATTYSVANGVVDFVAEEVEDDRIEELVEESFTVVLDEEGNLQEIGVSPSEEVQEVPMSKCDRVVEVVVNEEVVNVVGETDVDVSAEDTTNIQKISYEGNAKTQELDEENTDVNQFDEEIAETQEFEVEVDETEVKFKVVASTKMTLNQMNAGKQQISSAQPKLFERLVSSKGELPRSFEGVKLSQEDEGVLASAPNPEEISTRDLSRFQIGKRSLDFPKGGKKWESCPSRQAHLCPYCRQVLKTRNALSRHISVVHLDVKNFQCDQCDRSYATKADVMKHVRATHCEQRNVMVECEICGEEFKECYLKRHQYYKHKGNNLPKQCPYCSKDFKTREVMMKHIRKIHKKK